MGLFATEFPVSTKISKAQFAAQALAWARGIKETDLFSDGCIDDLSGDHVEFETESGEHLWIKYCGLYHGFVAGVRYEKPDKDGVTWRSEIVLTNKDDRASLRVKVQSLSTTGVAKALRPRKPYFVKMAIEDSWAEVDDGVQIGRKPIAALEIGVDRLSEILLGKFSGCLPVVYVSAPFHKGKQLSEADLEKLAHRLCGVAHVVVEPDREFSFGLLERTGGANPYGGTIALVSPERGVISSFFRGGKFSSDVELLNAVASAAESYMSSRLAVFAWDWSDLLDEWSRQLKNKVSESSDELDEYLVEQTKLSEEKDAEILRLRLEVQRLQGEVDVALNVEGGILSVDWESKLGPQLYRGEFSDRLRYAVELLEDRGGKALDVRTLEMVRRLRAASSYSGGAKVLADRIKSAGRDSKNADVRLQGILQEIGFKRRLDGGHPVLTPPEELFGVNSQTFSNSPSDRKSGKNKTFQLINGLGLRPLFEGD